MENINDFLQANLGLVYSQLHRFNLVDNPDAESLAYEALYKAAITYDDKQGTVFSTYAVCVISNTLRTLIRSYGKVRQLQTVSYNAPVGDDDESTVRLDLMPAKLNCEEMILNEELRDHIDAALQKLLESWAGTKKEEIFLVWQESNYTMTQQDIADKVGMSRAYVNRMIGSIRAELKQELEDYL